MTTYRADIDGLRAIAIVTVVLFHGGFETFSGGFVGVDVFFVVSGYLITGLLRDEMGTDTFSLVGFYERRVRRLLPALYCMLVIVALLGCALLMPHDLAEFGASMVAATSFGSNFLFATRTGYFDTPAALELLLHTWSLGVEEQYYLLFPGLLLILSRHAPSRTIPAVAVLWVLSLGIGIWSAVHAPAAGFFLIPSRFWELLLGSLLALGALPGITSRGWCNAAIASGVALILGSAVTFSAATPFPGTAALVPCLGTALIIQAGASHDTLARRLLSWRGAVFIGLISYSLYLWHWPLLVLLRQIVVAPTLTQRCVVLLGAVAIAVLSWRYIERPFRGRDGVLTRNALFGVATASTVLMITFGAALYLTGGVPQRLPADVAALAAAAQDRNPTTLQCFNPSAAAVGARDVCRIGAHTPHPPTFLLWGDSHANAIAPGIEAAALAAGKTGLFVAAAACPPLLGVMRFESRKAAACIDFNETVLDLVTRDRSIATVILAARWVISANGTRYKNEPGEPVFITDAQSEQTNRGSVAENTAVFRRGLSRTLHALAADGKHIVVVGPIPEIGWRVPDVMAKAAYFGTHWDIAPTLNEYRIRQRDVFAILTTLQHEVPFELVLPHLALCNDHDCPVARDGAPLYHDEEHLTSYGARTLTPLFSGVFR